MGETLAFDMALVVDDDDFCEPTLGNIMEQESLRWIFVGGKGGVGKTTTSCSLAIELAKVRESVLIISTDPAHNLSDAFGQKVTKAPTLLEGFENLFAMEIDPNVDPEELMGGAPPGMDGMAGGQANFMADISKSIPGVDEAMSFAELMKQVQTMEYSVIVFDTAPTGHTLRLIQFPEMLNKALDKVMGFKDKMGGMLSTIAPMMGGALPDMDAIFTKIQTMKSTIEEVRSRFRDPDSTTFVCVCIPEFLSVYETERLVQELYKQDMDTHNVVVNQIIFVPESLQESVQTVVNSVGPDAQAAVADVQKGIDVLLARRRMQQKYLGQIDELYEDFNVVRMPLLGSEVRGVAALKAFSPYLTTEYVYDGAAGEAKSQ